MKAGKRLRTLRSFSLLFVSCYLLCPFEVVRCLLTSDLDVVTRQLGYRPTNFVRVSARNHAGTPIAIQTYPLEGGARRRQTKARKSVDSNNVAWLGTPFPTLYWLTCPDISKCIGNLEREGFVKKIEQESQASDDMSEALCLAHQDYARRRWNSLSPDDRRQLTLGATKSTTIERMRNMLELSGIAGSNVTVGATPAIKCLHTHYAHFRSVVEDGGQLNPVGARVHELLTDEYPFLIL